MTQNSPAGLVNLDGLDRLDIRFVAYVDSDLKDLIPGFLVNRWRDARAIIGGVARKDYEMIRDLGHDMRGTGGAYGFDAITGIGRSLERAAKDENPTEVLKQAMELATYLERIEIVYE